MLGSLKAREGEPGVRNAIAGSRRLAVLGLIAVIAAVGLASVAFGAKAGSYKGQSESNRPVVFNLRDGKVRNFNGGITMYCVFSRTFRFDAAIPPRAMAVNGGRFNYKGQDRTGQNRIEIHGRFVSRRKAKGTIEMSAPPDCAAEVDFFATHR
jgi:hypothetical protein